MADLRLSVLDQSPISERSTEALRNTLGPARLADELGHHRYELIAEAFGLAGLAPALQRHLQA